MCIKLDIISYRIWLFGMHALATRELRHKFPCLLFKCIRRLSTNFNQREKMVKLAVIPLHSVQKITTHIHATSEAVNPKENVSFTSKIGRIYKHACIQAINSEKARFIVISSSSSRLFFWTAFCIQIKRSSDFFRKDAMRMVRDECVYTFL